MRGLDKGRRCEPSPVGSDEYRDPRAADPGRPVSLEVASVPQAPALCGYTSHDGQGTCTGMTLWSLPFREPTGSILWALAERLEGEHAWSPPPLG